MSEGEVKGTRLSKCPGHLGEDVSAGVTLTTELSSVKCGRDVPFLWGRESESGKRRCKVLSVVVLKEPVGLV